MVYVGPNNPYGVVAPPKHGIGSGELPANGGNPYAIEIGRAVGSGHGWSVQTR